MCSCAPSTVSAPGNYIIATAVNFLVDIAGGKKTDNKNNLVLKFHVGSNGLKNREKSSKSWRKAST